MAQLSGKSPDAKPLHDFGVGFHNPLVRSARTLVKLDRVRMLSANAHMADELTVGEKLAAIRARAGMSMDEVARAAGYKGRSSVQRFFDPGYNPVYLPMDVAERFAKAFDGKGKEGSTISGEELLTLAGVTDLRVQGFSVAEKVSNIGAMPRDIPVYGTALGAEATFDEPEGSGSISVEQAELDQSEVLGYLRRPPALVGRKDVYGVYISGSSMFPRFNDGEGVFVDPKRPPLIGDDVIVHLAAPDEHDGERVHAVLIKRLVRRSGTFVELEQFNPPLTFRLTARQVKRIHRIVPTAELFS